MKKGKTHKLSTQEIDRIIEMAWEDRTPFEAIEKQFGLNQDDVIKIMRKSIKRSFKLTQYQKILCTRFLLTQKRSI